MKTHEEIEALKKDWFNDPIYDIEDAEGFEEYKDELLQYRLACESKWKEGYKNRIKTRAEKLNCSVELIEYIERLETQIEGMERKVDLLYFG